MKSSRLAGFYKLSVAERIEQLERMGWLTAAESRALSAGRHLLAKERADGMIENVVGVFGLPFAVAPNFVCNGREYLVPLVVEEPSIVAALSGAAAMARDSGGFAASCDESLLIGQIHLADVGDIDAALAALRSAEAELLALANEVHPRLVARGGGARAVEVHRQQLESHSDIVVVHVLVDTCDAMGANLINTICESLAPRVEEICGGHAALRILSNLADRSLVTASVTIPCAKLASDEMDGQAVRDAIVLANDIARVDAHRAATHNKGIMNGVDPLAIATGNDWRAIEAGAHAYAARDGRYRALTEWTAAESGDLQGRLTLPLKLGTVGGTLAANPAAQLGLALTGVNSATELAELMAVVGLAQNFAAVRALATSGIQRGHMRLHARNLAMAAGAEEGGIDTVVERLISSGDIKAWKAEELVAELRAPAMPDDAPTADGKVILLGEHAVVYGQPALALPLPRAVTATACVASGSTLRVREWGLSTDIDKQATTGPAAVVATILDRLGCADRDFAIEVTTHLPRGKGLGSSAAIAVAVTRAIAQALSLQVDDATVNQIAYACEQLMHGTPSGVDNTVSTYGAALQFQRDADPAIEFLRCEPPPLVIGISHQTGHTDTMVAAVRKHRDAARARTDSLFSTIGELVLQGRTALVERDYDRLGGLMNVCQGLLNAIGVSTAELEAMIEIARHAGATGAKLTGAGGGGAMIALCPGRQGEVAAALSEAGFSTLELQDSSSEH